MADPGDFHVLMAMRAKQGETNALKALRVPDQLAHLQLLIDVDPFASMVRQRTNLVTLTTKVNELGRLPMIDVAEVAANGADEPARTLGEVTDRLPSDLFTSPSFIPVVRDNCTNEFATFVGRLCEELETGAALRVRPGVAHENLRRVFEHLRLSPADVDLVLDWRYIKNVDDNLVASVVAMLRATEPISGFRSTTLLSGSIPSIMSQTSSWQEPRLEESLWQLVRDGGVSDLRFGDYGVVHPIPAEGYRSHHVTVKYTCPRNWLYLRERMDGDAEPDPDGQDEAARARTLRVLCRNLVATDEYSGPEFSWGDREIHVAASGLGASLGNSSKPVAIGTSHHLAYLASMAAA